MRRSHTFRASLFTPLWLCTVVALGGLGCTSETGSEPVPQLTQGVGETLDLPLGILPANEAESLAAEIAGPDGVACGRAGLDATDDARAALHRCVSQSFAGGTPFWASYELPSIDSQVAEVWATTAEGEVFVVVWDARPCGSDACDPALHTLRCEGPEDAGAAPGDAPLACESTPPVLMVVD